MNTGWPEPQEFWSKRRVCVTGGAGFIGSHIVTRLLALGVRVCSLDNYARGLRENLDSARCSSLKSVRVRVMVTFGSVFCLTTGFSRGGSLWPQPPTAASRG